jgi:hypothetical protein
MTNKAELDKYRPKVSFADVFGFVTTHPGLVVFLVYAIIAIAGFIYLVTFYEQFKFEATVYLEITDILVAGIKDPLVILMVLGSFTMVFIVWLLVYIQAPFSAWLDKKFNKGFFRFIPHLIGYRGPKSFWWTAFIILTVYFYMFIGVHAQNKANAILTHKQSLVSVNSEATNQSKDDFSLLGTSINYVFLYNHQLQSVLILPLEAINSIQPIASKKASSDTSPKPNLKSGATQHSETQKEPAS